MPAAGISALALFGRRLSEHHFGEADFRFHAVLLQVSMSVSGRPARPAV